MQHELLTSYDLDACMRQKSLWSLVQVMGCRLLCANPWTYCQVVTWEQFSVKFKSEYIFIVDNIYLNIIYIHIYPYAHIYSFKSINSDITVQAWVSKLSNCRDGSHELVWQFKKSQVIFGTLIFEEIHKSKQRIWFCSQPWWRHQMETFSALLAICAGNSVNSLQRPVTRSFDDFFYLHPNKRLSKQWWGWWFETPSCPLWRHRNALCLLIPCIAGYSREYSARVITNFSPA